MNNKNLCLKLSILSDSKLNNLEPDLYDSISLKNPYCSKLSDYSNKNKAKTISSLNLIKKLGAKCGIVTPAVTVESQMETVLEYIKELSKIIDYVEISDIGVLRQIKKHLPDLEIHIGPLANISTQNSLNLIEKSGVNVIHPGYELDFNQIAELAANTRNSTCIETTVFGKICLGIAHNCFNTKKDFYSENCNKICLNKDHALSWNGFDILLKGKAVYSDKSMCLIDYIPHLKNAGITKLKIEGLFETAHYINEAGTIFKQAIAEINQNGKFKEHLLSEYKEKLSLLDKRGLANGFFFSVSGRDYIKDKAAKEYLNDSFIKKTDVSIKNHIDLKKSLKNIKNKKSLKKVKLLSPANSFETVKTAFNAGADAVYVGVRGWSLRPTIFELSEDDLYKSINLAKSYNKEIYICFNIFPTTAEIPALLDDAKRMYDAGVSALIMADPGAIKELHEAIPDLPIHASVQCNVTNSEAAKYYYDLGCSTVIISRSFFDSKELEPICKNSPAEVEVFIQGDICYNYDSKCYLTGYMKKEKVDNSSRREETPYIGCSNRGECYLICKHSCNLLDNKKIIDTGSFLRREDLCLLKDVPRLINCGVSIFKIEGRQFDNNYIKETTSIYRKAIDEYYKKASDFSINENEFIKLRDLLKDREISYEFQRQSWLGE